MAAAPRKHAASIARVAVVFAALLLIVVLLQALGNAYGSDFSGYPDESAHFITGLMIHDYITGGFPHSPVKFAEAYYVHYPKIAFGMWGPLLHVGEGVWELIFPVSRASILVLMAIITAATGALLYVAIASELGFGLALFGAVLFVAVPNVQSYTGMVMADGLCALFDLCAMMAFARFLDSENWKDSLRFGIYATLAILVKGNGVALALLPAFALLFSGKLRLLLRPPLWAALIPVVLFAVPWQYFSIKMLLGIHEPYPGWFFLPRLTVLTVTAVGWGLLPIWLFGVYDRLIANRKRASGLWASAAALICAFWLFHALVPSAGPEPRYVIAITPAAILFLCAGIRRIATLLPASTGRETRRIGAVAGVAALIFVTTAFSIPQKINHGFDQVAARLEEPPFQDRVVLVCSSGDGEGMLISELAMRERRPGHIILRATKMLARSNWIGLHYVELYTTPQDLMKFLESVPVELVVIDDETGRTPRPDQMLLKQTIAESPDKWDLVGTFPQGGSQSGTIRIYRLKDASGRPPGKIHIDLPYTLRRPIDW